jgi:hypothetical protein
VSRLRNGSEWIFAFEALTGVCGLVLKREQDVEEREAANETQLQLHESLHAHATQAVTHIGTSFRLDCQSIDNERLRVLHPMRQLSVEMFREIF